ncbi:hypothetical protein M0654_11180 [Rhizobium sp. NTR19]|uniref:Uncharacterized protein n=1 Tax=Neorhizobium turbinariae TaxID=2937795 RepID=A0ABT0IRP0_9HYPH|nr:hypothetical protein [Neorhizobium turbinariae]MCK8780548.1 hypothetical protein [Neorhizobium turbinariae]
MVVVDGRAQHFQIPSCAAFVSTLLGIVTARPAPDFGQGHLAKEVIDAFKRGQGFFRTRCLRRLLLSVDDDDITYGDFSGTTAAMGPVLAGDVLGKPFLSCFNLSLAAFCAEAPVSVLDDPGSGVWPEPEPGRSSFLRHLSIILLIPLRVTKSLLAIRMISRLPFAASVRREDFVKRP